MMRPPASQDASADLAAALERLPALPVLTGPPAAPTGWRWIAEAAFRERGAMEAYSAAGAPLDLGAALRGKWEPQRRYCQGQAVAYVQQPTYTKGLDDVAALSTRPFCATMSSDRGPMLHPLSQVAGSLAVRARVKMNSGDWRGAVEDLNACLNLASGIEDDSTFPSLLWAIGLRSTAAQEAGCLAREFTLSPEQAEAFRSLWTHHRFDPRAAWTGCLAGESEYAMLSVDAQYTGRRGGRGFYVARDISAGGSLAIGFFNLFSPCYESRPQMEAHYARLQQRTAGLIETLDHPEEDAEPPTRPKSLLPPFRFARQAALGSWRARIRQDAAAAAVLLTAWYREHGSYPASLDELGEPWQKMLRPTDMPKPAMMISYKATGKGYVLTSEGQPILERGEPFDEGLLVEVGS